LKSQISPLGIAITKGWEEIGVALIRAGATLRDSEQRHKQQFEQWREIANIRDINRWEACMKSVKSNDWSQVQKEFVHLLQKGLLNEKYSPKEVFPFGSVPFGIFTPLESHLRSIASEQKQVEQKLNKIDAGIHQLELEINELTKRKESLENEKRILQQQQEHLIQFEPLCEPKYFEEITRLSNLEQQIKQQSIERIQNPEWDILHITDDDVLTILSEFDLDGLICPSKNSPSFSSLKIALIDLPDDKHFLDKAFPQARLDEICQLKYANEMIQKRKMNWKEHNNECPSCSPGLDEFCREYSIDLNFEKYPLLEPRHLLFIPFTILQRTFSLSREDGLKIFLKLRTARNFHNNALSPPDHPLGG